jgi:Ca2+-binding EF-hand superfamily protein
MKNLGKSCCSSPASLNLTITFDVLGEELDQQGLQKMVAEADFDGDGKISYKDFCLCMQNVSKDEGMKL